MSRVVVNEIEAKVGNDITFNDTIKIDTIKGKTTAGSIVVTSEGTSTTTNLQQGLAKMWFYKNTAGTAFADSFNTSSLTDTGTGDFTVVFSNNMNNAFYGLGKGSTIAHDGQTSSGGEQLAGIESSSLRIKTYQNGGIGDFPTLGSIHGDLA